jgi:hypothetical protein
MKNIIRKYPAKLVYNNGYWFVDLFSLGKIDLGDDIPESLEIMQDIILKSQSATSLNKD